MKRSVKNCFKNYYWFLKLCCIVLCNLICIALNNAQNTAQPNDAPLQESFQMLASLDEQKDNIFGTVLHIRQTYLDKLDNPQKEIFLQQLIEKWQVTYPDRLAILFQLSKESVIVNCDMALKKNQSWETCDKKNQQWFDFWTQKDLCISADIATVIAQYIAYLDLKKMDFWYAKSEEVALKNECSSQLVNREFALANYNYIILNEPFLGLKHNLRAVALADSLSDVSDESKITAYESLAFKQFHAQNYLEALETWKKMLPLVEGKGRLYFRILDNIGQSYIKLGDYENGKIYYEKAIEAAKKGNDDAWIGIASGNLGHLYYKQGDFAKALPLLHLDIREGYKSDSYNCVLASIKGCSEYYLKNNQLAKVVPLRDTMQLCLNKLGSPIHALSNNRTRLDWYEINAYYYSNIGEISNASFWQNKVKLLRDSIFDSDKAAKLGYLQHTYDESVRLKAEEKQENDMMKIGFLIAVLALGIIAYFYFRKHEVIVIEVSNEEKILEHQTLLHQEREKQLSYMEQLKSMTVLTEDDWEQFKAVFLKLHPTFFDEIKQKYPDLTKAETRLLAFERLHLEDREIANMQGISTQSVSKTRYRLNKKIQEAENV